MMKIAYCVSLILISGYLYAEVPENGTPASIDPTELQTLTAQPPKVQKAIELLLALTKQQLKYQYASADPKTGGMDCSGTIFYVLSTLGLHHVPRSSDLQYEWVATQGQFYPVADNVQSIESNQFAHLQLGDLLFWSGTYNIKRSINVTHVMMYIGKNQAGHPLMAGASNGRTYKGRKINGVSVFDFKTPDKDSHGHFLGYGCVPNLNCKHLL